MGIFKRFRTHKRSAAMKRGAFVALLTLALVLPASVYTFKSGCAAYCISNSFGSSVGDIFLDIFDEHTSPDLQDATDDIIATFDSANEDMRLNVSDQITTSTDNIRRFMDQFWFYDMRPSLQDQTAQHNTEISTAAQHNAAFNDSYQQNMTIMEKQIADYESARDTRPSEKVCTAASSLSGLTRANEIREAMGRAGARQALTGTSGTGGGGGYAGSVTAASSGGAANAIKTAYARYQSRYCNVKDNNGTICASDGTYPDADIQPVQQIFEPDTIKFDEPEVKQTIDDTLRNIIEPETATPTAVQQKTIEAAAGQEAILERRRLLAQRQAMWNLGYWYVGMRSPGSNSGTYLNAIRQEAGIPLTDISDNPSYYEVMQAMVAERYRTGKANVENIDTAENVTKELVVNQALTAMLLNDQIDLMDRYAFVLAGKAATEIDARARLSASSTVPGQ